ncbi:MAG: DMT family transporter [Pseudomonadota bacterium]
MEEKNFALGLAAAVGVIFIWSGFIVFSRLGVTSSLTPFDVSGLRFLVAGALTLPFALAWWPRALSAAQVAVLVATGPGSIYSILMYFGLANAPAAYAGVFANGSLPLFTMLLAAAFAGDAPGPRRLIAVAVIVGGGVLVAWRGLGAAGPNLWEGLALFLSASALLSVYIFCLGRWRVGPRQALAVINVPNAVLFLPLWFAVLPSGLSEASWGEILFQAAFQGLGPGFLAVILFTAATMHLGPTPTAGFSAAVPAGAALLAIPVLGEVPSPLEWTGVFLVTLGLVILVLRRA